MQLRLHRLQALLLQQQQHQGQVAVGHQVVDSSLQEAAAAAGAMAAAGIAAGTGQATAEAAALGDQCLLEDPQV
jgi:hypothetical protein